MHAVVRMGSRLVCYAALAASMACGDGDGQAVGSVDAGAPGDDAAPSEQAVNAAQEMAACRAEHSHAECLFRAIDRYFEATSCGGTAPTYAPGERECIVEAYDKLDQQKVACLEMNYWLHAQCVSEAACDLQAIEDCQIIEANEDCPGRITSAQADEIAKCIEE